MRQIENLSVFTDVISPFTFIDMAEYVCCQLNTSYQIHIVKHNMFVLCYIG